MRLSPNFTLEEMTWSMTSIRRGIPNIPNENVIANLKVLAQSLEEVRAVMGEPIIVNSGYRSPRLNAAIGGSLRSAHMRGLAADIRALSLFNAYEMAERIVMAEIDYDKLIYEGAWVHFQIAPPDKIPRGQLLTALFDSEGVKYVPGLVA